MTEILFDADTLEHHNEFVEIYNAGTAAVNLQDWLIGDAGELDAMEDTGEGFSLASGQYGIILDGSYFGSSTTYDSLIPPEALVLAIDDGTFGNYGWSNSEPEPVILVDAGGDTVQVYFYSINNEPGYSDEKILLTGDNSPGNWTNSEVLHGTPGFINSVTPLERDLVVDTIRVVPRYPVSETGFQLYARVINRGLSGISDFPVQLFRDLNGNFVPDDNELLDELICSENLQFNDSAEIEFDMPGLPAGSYSLGVIAVFPSDQDLSNNLKFKIIHLEALENPVVINEIMYRPAPGEPEWVELYNTGIREINLQNWSFADFRDTVSIGAESYWLAAGGFAVLSQDSAVFQFYPYLNREYVRVIKSLPTLNNDTDDIQLISAAGRPIDRVNYSAEWMRRDTEAGVSLERISPEISSSSAENWAASADSRGATPGEKNSLFTELPVKKSAVAVNPNPFSPDSDGFEDFAIIEYHLPVQTAFVTLDIYDMMGRHIRRLADKEPVGPDGRFIWDGRDQNSRISRIGMYVLLFRLFEKNRNLFKEVKTSLVLMKRK